MNVRPRDWVSVIEAGYNLEGSESQWLRRIQDLTAPMFGRGGEPVAWTFRFTPTTFALGEFAEGTSAATCAVGRVAHGLASEKSMDLTYRSGVTIATASELVFPQLPEMQRLVLGLFKALIRDLLVVNCQSGQGSGVSIGMLLREESRTTAEERRRWSQVGAHLGAALRLRSLLTSPGFESPAVEAVLDPGGKVQEARGPAESGDARENLRRLVREIEHTRTRLGRQHADEALDQWEALISGRWSLVDRFDSDGRRYVVAVKNDPAQPDPRGLTVRERQIAEYVGLGRTSKEIAYTLGLSEAAITNCTARTQVKLGLGSRVELAAFFAPNGIRRKLAERTVGGVRWLFGSHPLADAPVLSRLSQAEREIVGLMIGGSTNADIAERRAASERTVANQVQSVFHKLNVHSRGELVARLLA